MSTRKTTLFYALLIAVASAAVGMVIASKLELAPTSAAQSTLSVPPPTARRSAARSTRARSAASRSP